jgi:small-conductance mechanosensitive channel
VIIPNSLIGQSQVINYSYPDPSLRVQTDIGVAYGTDIDLMKQVIVEAVRGIEGVLPDKPVDVLYVACGDSARQIRVRWWIDDVNDQYFTLHQVNAALELALSEAGFDMPYPTYTLNFGQSVKLSVDARDDGGAMNRTLQTRPTTSTIGGSKPRS